MPTKLTAEQITQHLGSTPNWSVVDGELQRELSFKDFLAAIEFVNKLAVECERLDHHPDLLVHQWNKVRIRVSTHSAGGLTELDFQLAGAVDAISE